MKPSDRVCIVGSGVAGSFLAESLLARGAKDVLMLEAGPAFKMRDPRVFLDAALRSPSGFDPFGDANARDHLFYDDTSAELSGNLPFPPPGVRARGGSTLVWGGQVLRLMPEDFRLRTNTGRGLDWPISYDDLEPYYAKAEVALHVSGDHREKGHPPRSGPFPLPPFELQASDGRFVDACKSLGIGLQRGGFCHNTRAIGGMPACQLNGVCQYCPIGGRFTGDQPLDRLEALPGFRLRTGSVVRRLVMKSRSQVGAVEVFDTKRGTTERIEADWIVLALGGVETPKLLQASTSDGWANGVGNARGHVGANLESHLVVIVSGVYGEGVPNTASQLAIPTVHSRHFDSAGAQKSGKYKFFFGSRDDYKLERAVSRGASNKEIAEVMLRESKQVRVNVESEMFSSSQNHVRLIAGTDRLGLPRAKIHFDISTQDRTLLDRATGTVRQILERMGCVGIERGEISQMAHVLCTHRMGKNPEEGVVDANLRVFDTENLFLTGMGVFSSAGVANPTLTVVALSLRLADHLLPERA